MSTHKERVYLKFPISGRNTEGDGERHYSCMFLWKNSGGEKGNLSQPFHFEMPPLFSLVRHQTINPGP